MGIPNVDEVDGIPPAVALQQQRGTPRPRSSVGSVTTLSNLLRMLYSRAGGYPPGQSIIYAEEFSPNTPRAPARPVPFIARWRTQVLVASTYLRVYSFSSAAEVSFSLSQHIE
jgi:hypothetical protein